MVMRWLWLAVACGVWRGAAGELYGFYVAMRGMGGGGLEETRRVFGGAPAREWSPACAMLDRGLVPVCSGSVLAPRWALTAAHCVRPVLAYVRYNGRSSDDNLAVIDLLFAHPEYKVHLADEGGGMDVVLLHNDVGLVRTRREMTLAVPPLAPREPRVRLPLSPVPEIDVVDVNSLLGKEVELLGFGRSERAGASATLRAARLQVTACQRGDDAWRYCGCAVGNASGVCSGDSGGPVLYKGKQIGVTSMGPLRCAAPASARGEAAPALSVFTSLRPYAALIDATINGPEDAERMREVYTKAARLTRPQPLLLAAAPAVFRALY